MTIQQKKDRKHRRCQKRRAQNQEVRDYVKQHDCSFAEAMLKYGCYVWYDSDSPTGYSQYCSYVGTCQSPCNGDC